MSPFAASLTKFLSFWIVVCDALILIIVIALVAKKFGSDRKLFLAILNFFGKHAVMLSFLAALGAMLGSLFYSEIAGFPPCSLCWWQRAMLYPQVFILGWALFKKDRDLRGHSILLSAIGGAIALYQTYLQFGGLPFLPCSATGISISCSKRYFLEFGYVTIPTMTLTVFALIIAYMLAAKAIEPSKNGERDTKSAPGSEDV